MEYLPSYRDSLYADIQPSYQDSLTHHGIKGQKWGVRRYQNTDGTLTPAGQKRYNKNFERTYKKATKNFLRRNATTVAGNHVTLAVLTDHANSPETKRVNELEFPTKEYLQTHTKQEHSAELEDAYNQSRKLGHTLVNKYLDKHADILMKDMKLKNDLGVKDALKKAMVDNAAASEFLRANW